MEITIEPQKFHVGDKVRLMTYEEVRKKWPGRMDDEYHYYAYTYRGVRTYLRKHVFDSHGGKELTIRMVRPHTCKAEEIENMGTSLPKELLVLVNDAPYRRELAVTALLTELMSTRIQSEDHLHDRIADTAKRVCAVFK